MTWNYRHNIWNIVVYHIHHGHTLFLGLKGERGQIAISVFHEFMLQRLSPAICIQAKGLSEKKNCVVLAMTQLDFQGTYAYSDFHVETFFLGHVLNFINHGYTDKWCIFVIMFPKLSIQVLLYCLHGMANITVFCIRCSHMVPCIDPLIYCE